MFVVWSMGPMNVWFGKLGRPSAVRGVCCGECAECPSPNVGRRRVFPFKVLKVYCGLCNFQIHHRIAILCGDGTVGHDDDGATLGVGGQTLQ